MKKQYQAPSVEIELQGISNFCAGCSQDAREWEFAWGAYQGGAICFNNWVNSGDVDNDFDICYNNALSVAMFS